MGGVDDALAAAFRELVHGDFLRPMPQPNLARRHRRLHPLADQPPRRRIGVAIHLHRAIVADLAFERAAGAKRRAPGQRLQPACLLLGETLRRRLARGPMQPRIGHIALPGR